ncbi:MAG: phosphoribosylamine--glycine ligase [Lentisphaeria bacterium]|nr:phosphoribosylamine--glycine ligase [Lentisphaeria bacterium]
MRVLVLGSGGREHAICDGLKRSKEVTELYCSPGNPGIAKIAKCVALSGEGEDIADFAEKNNIDLVMVGPEAPLVKGVTDAVRARGIAAFGPSGKAAQLEGSKDFAKKFMVENNIPTAKYMSFTSAEPALEYVRSEYAAGREVVVKADGLAAGKGVIVAANQQEAEDAVKECFSGAFGSAGSMVVIEELLIGEEASILALTDGENILPLASSQDHKRLLDGDKGPNTGGMGAYSPAPVVTDALMERVQKEVLENFLKGLKKSGLFYRGIIYAGIMATKEGPKVLEFNVRFGDPETQAVLPRLKSSLFDTLMKTAQGKVGELDLQWDERVAVSVVLASGGYPGSVEKGFEITGLEEAENSGCRVYHAGTDVKDGKIVNSGGRVLAVTSFGKDVPEAISAAYTGVEKISWKDMQYRKDIAQKAVNRKG